MKILFAASEMDPFCKTGGLADVLGALPPVLAEMGHKVVVMLPGYKVIDRDKWGFRPTGVRLDVPLGKGTRHLGLSTLSWNGVDVLLLESEEFFWRDSLYGDIDGDYDDNDERFAFFSRATLELTKNLGLKPDIVHSHDWQAGLVPAYLKTVYVDDPYFSGTKTFFTIHNLGYQGLFPKETFPKTLIPKVEFTWKKMEYWGKVSYLKAGLVYSDLLSTVSEAYADEITREPLGFGMQGVFEERKESLYGIVNGIDVDMWNPETDSAIASTFSARTTKGKKACRESLLRKCGLKAAASAPLVGMVTRLDDQKGLDIFEDSVARLMSLDIRLVVLGTGSKKHHETMSTLEKRYNDRIKVFLTFNNDLARQIYAGSDAFLMPSRYEPCGLGQLIAMRYGSLPIVHATGGLKDTVQDVDQEPDSGVGFVFDSYSPEALADAVGRAVVAFREKGRRRWTAALKRAMNRDFSWTNSAERYVELYEELGRG